MPKSGTATSNASIPYLMGRNLGSFCGVEVGECIIVNHREVPYVVRSGLGASRLTGCDVEHAPSVSARKSRNLWSTSHSTSQDIATQRRLRIMYGRCHDTTASHKS